MEIEKPNSSSEIFDGVNTRRKAELNKVIKKARTSLFVIAGFTLAFSFIVYFMNQEKEDAYYELVADVIISVTFALLGFLSNTKPYLALLAGLILYSLLIILAAIVNPLSLFKGVILRIAIITWLVKGIISARRIENIIEV
jgi:hypothetical protein